MSIDAPMREFLDAITVPTTAEPPPVDECERLRTEIDQLKRALVFRSTIEQAKGIVMAVERCNPEEAFDALVRMSQNSNVPLRDVASALVYQASNQD